jgi:SAM-dependent methyltransferase
MQAEIVQRQYDEVIASHYDFDPQEVVGLSLDRALEQVRRADIGCTSDGPVKVLDVGMGTGRFFEKLGLGCDLAIEPFGLDISQKMIDIAHTRIPNLVAEIADAANLDDHFASLQFELVATHFITGFVPVNLLAPKIWQKLAPGGYWSFVGGTRAGFPALQRLAQSKLVRCVLGGATVDIGGLVSNPANQDEVVGVLEANDYVIHQCVTIMPKLLFKDFDEFMEFAYYGGWLTPFIEKLGLHQAKPLTRIILDKLCFPLTDAHHIVVALAQKRE